MNDSDSLASISSFIFSGYGVLTILFVAGLLAFLWSNELKRRWHDRVERKKWEYWNRPSVHEEAVAERVEKSIKR